MIKFSIIVVLLEGKVSAVMDIWCTFIEILCPLTTAPLEAQLQWKFRWFNYIVKNEDIW